MTRMTRISMRQQQSGKKNNNRTTFLLHEDWDGAVDTGIADEAVGEGEEQKTD